MDAAAGAARTGRIVYGQQTVGGWTVHDLRHTALTNLLAEGADIATVRDWDGHASLAAQASSALVKLTGSTN